MEKPGRTLLAKIWDQHVIARIGDDTDLLHVDRHLLHDLGGSRGLLDLKSRNLNVHESEARAEASGMMVAVIVLMLVGVALSAMIWRLQAYLLRWQQHNMVE